jgi:adenine-specific DNA-methyltransferase
MSEEIEDNNDNIIIEGGEEEEEQNDYTNQLEQQNNQAQKVELIENKGKKIQDIWDFRDPGFVSESYPTEKDEDLLQQIILSSSKEGDLILDCFCGSGTTIVAAEKLKRNWIGIDSNESAIKTTEKKLLSLVQKQDLFRKPPSFIFYKTT